MGISALILPDGMAISLAGMILPGNGLRVNAAPLAASDAGSKRGFQSSRGEVSSPHRRRGDGDHTRGALVELRPFPTSEQEGLVLYDRTAGGDAVLIAPVDRLDGVGRQEKVARVHIVVAQEFEYRAVELVGAAFDRRVDDGAWPSSRTRLWRSCWSPLLNSARALTEGVGSRRSSCSKGPGFWRYYPRRPERSCSCRSVHRWRRRSRRSSRGRRRYRPDPLRRALPTPAVNFAKSR